MTTCLLHIEPYLATTTFYPETTHLPDLGAWTLVGLVCLSSTDLRCHLRCHWTSGFCACTRCYVVYGKTRLRFSVQLMWEFHIGFPKIDIATLLSTFTPWGSSIKVPRATYKDIGSLYNISSFTRQFRKIDLSIGNVTTLSAHPRLLKNCTGRVKSHKLIYNNGIYTIESTKWISNGGIYNGTIARPNLTKHSREALNSVQSHSLETVRTMTSHKRHNNYAEPRQPLGATIVTRATAALRNYWLDRVAKDKRTKHNRLKAHRLAYLHIERVDALFEDHRPYISKVTILNLRRKRTF